MFFLVKKEVGVTLYYPKQEIINKKKQVRKKERKEGRKEGRKEASKTLKKRAIEPIVGCVCVCM
jgi:vacuolar-type H+-ATPase subunit H